MAEPKRWYIICYDIRDPKRWRKAYKLFQGYGESLQFSVFRCQLNQRDREKLRWELSKILASDDKLILIGICPRCAEHIPLYNQPGAWPQESQPFRIV
jgi:CRISPR-associated protein Cas2